MSSFDWSPTHGNAVLLGLAGALALILLLARRLARSPIARSWPLLIVRGAVLAVLLALLLNPVRITQSRLPPQAPEVCYLVDCSRSIALDKPVSRLDQVKGVLARSKRLAAGAPAHVNLYRFGQDLLALHGADELDANDDATRLKDSLERLLSRFETLPGSVVLFSDGRATEPDALAEVAAAYHRLKVPVHVFPVGDPGASGDVAIQDV